MKNPRKINPNENVHIPKSPYGILTCDDVTPSLVELLYTSSWSESPCGVLALLVSFCERKGAVTSGAMDVPRVKQVCSRITGVAAAFPQVARVRELQTATQENHEC